MDQILIEIVTSDVAPLAVMSVLLIRMEYAMSTLLRACMDKLD